MSRPFNGARYAALLEGLEISILLKSEVAAGNEVARLDADYFSKNALAGLRTLRAKPHSRLGKVAFITDGIHASINFCEGSGIKVISAKHPKENFFDLTSFEEISKRVHLLNPRTELQVGDVIVSTVGTIGNAAVVTKEILPANSDRHVGIIRCRSDYPPEFISTFFLSRYGRLQTTREATGNVQQNLFISKLREVIIPNLSTEFRNLTKDVVLDAQRLFRRAANLIESSEGILLSALGLTNWHPPEPLTYTRNAAAAFAARRLDAEYFTPRVAELLARLSADGLTVRDVAPLRQERFSPGGGGEFDYLEIGGVRGDGTVISERLPRREAPSRATSYVRAGDIITSTVRPIRRLSALIMPEQDGFVCSSGFAVLRPTEVPPELLLTYLRLPLICALMDLHTSASLYPAIAERDILLLPFRAVPPEAEAAIVSAVQRAHAARREARALLERAKRAVEIAIEDSETAALALLAGPLES